MVSFIYPIKGNKIPTLSGQNVEKWSASQKGFFSLRNSTNSIALSFLSKYRVEPSLSMSSDVEAFIR